MEAIVANVGGLTFDIEIDLETQRGAKPLPFAGMDSEYWVLGDKSSSYPRPVQMCFSSLSRIHCFKETSIPAPSNNL